MAIQSQSNYASVRQLLQAPSWEFRQANTPDWKPTKIPASVHTALFQNGMIEDPFYRDNEDKLQWIEKEDWEFQTTFDVEPLVFSKKHIELVFKGIDTYSQIFLNDSLILETDNMFRTWKVDVKQLLKATGNKLHI